MPLWTRFPWSRARRAEGALAASLYETLSGEDERLLEEMLREDPSFRREAAELRALRAMNLLETPEFTGDLLPAVRAGLAEAPAAHHSRAFPRALAAAAVAVLAAGVYFAAGPLPTGPAPTREAAESAAPSPLAGVLEQARASLQRRDFAGARTSLTGALAAAPDDPGAGAAQALLADMEYAHLQRYPQAHAAYTRLRERYPDTFTTDPRSIERFNLLDEARAYDYAPLRALDFAREHREEALPQLERVIARYPGTMLAAAAVSQIIHPSGAAAGQDPAAAVLALEDARSRCVEPAAVAQLNLALGGLYCDAFHDEAQARDLFLQAASGGSPAVSTQAQAALARLEP
ncbi:MAG: hypothetical protein GXY15_15500 [Candidatus Hydrogenedentes bacterium]|nr:hypothetical protein [Candidatus Hydrogenedentota bacterium]